MKITRFIFLAICVAGLSFHACKTTQTAQEKAIKLALHQAKEHIYAAESALESEDYPLALQHMLKVDSLSPFQANIPFKVGLCYFQLKEYKKAKQYFNQTLAHKPKEQIPIDAYFYSGLTYYQLNQADSALFFFTNLQDSVANLKDKRFLAAITREINRCNELMRLKTKPVDWQFVSLGDTINSAFDDHSPVVNGDESVLIFTSKRAKQKVNDSNEFYEDIYISHKKAGKWQKPQSISDSINTADHEASIGLSADGSNLLIYKSEENGSIFESSLNGHSWSRPTKLNRNINSAHRETHACMTADGHFLYFTSDRPGGFGGMDLYRAERLPNGKWGEAKNLGHGVNTAFDEESPFIHPNGTTLYFSSKGHNSIGGFDIFQTELNQFGTWTKPINMGYPVNTITDDVFFVLSADGKRAYYASVNKKTKVSDLRMGHLPQAKVVPLTVMIGRVRVACGELPPVNITVNDIDSSEIVGIYAPNTKTGKFIFFLKRGRQYSIAVEANDEEVLVDTLQISTEAKFEEIYKTIQVPPLEPCLPAKDTISSADTSATLAQPEKKKIKFDGDKKLYDEAIGIRDILFPSGKASIAENESLVQLAIYLLNNPTAVVEIGGHSDAKGSREVNYRVARKRANVAKDYLLRKGVFPEQLKVISYGPDQPIATNKNKKGQWIPEAMKFNRRIAFKVIRQGKRSLKILPIDLVPEKWRVK